MAKQNEHEKMRQARPRSATSLLCDLPELSRISGVPYSSLHRAAAEGSLPIPIVKIGESRRMWVKRADIPRLIERSTITAA